MSICQESLTGVLELAGYHALAGNRIKAFSDNFPELVTRGCLGEIHQFKRGGEQNGKQNHSHRGHRYHDHPGSGPATNRLWQN